MVTSDELDSKYEWILQETFGGSNVVTYKSAKTREFLGVD